MQYTTVQHIKNTPQKYYQKMLVILIILSNFALLNKTNSKYYLLERWVSG